MVRKIGDVILWLLGLICLLSAVAFAMKSDVTFLVPLGYLILTVLFIPVTWDMVKKMLRMNIHTAWRIVLILVVYISTGIILSKDLGLTVDYGADTTTHNQIRDSLINEAPDENNTDGQ